MSSRCLGSRASASAAVAWEGKHRNPEGFPPSSSFPQAFTAGHDVTWYEDPFAWFGSAVLTMSPPSRLPTPSLLVAGAEWEKEKALTLCKHCPAAVVCYQHFVTDPTRGAIRAAVKEINSSVSQTQCTALSVFR